MPSIAFATYAKLPLLADNEHPLIDVLAERGVRAKPVVWDDASVDWSSFDAVVIRSCWDYHLRYEEFFAWVSRVTRLGVKILNPPSLLRWNSRKTYLHDLAAAGIRIVPTIWLLADGPRGANPSLASILEAAHWNDAVVKPIVSASAHETWRLSPEDARANEANDARMHRLIAGTGAMIQPFLPEISANGEWSLLFFDGKFSHAVLKRAAPGEFRVQRMFGGTHERVDPPQAVLHAAHRALRSAPANSVYARVDGVTIDGDFALTELEVLDASLFLDADVEAPTRFAAAIASAVAS